MTDLQYQDLAESALKAIEVGCDRLNDESDVDIDNQRTGGMITFNLQKPLQEIWMAAKAGGFHYQFDGAQWMDTKGAGELFAHLSRYASEQSGQALSFTAPEV